MLSLINQPLTTAQSQGDAVVSHSNPSFNPASVAIGKAERQVRKALHCGNKQQ